MNIKSHLPTQKSTGHRARKRFGQNFLTSEVTISQLIGAIAAQSGQRIVEIGPGLGVLTEQILASGANLTAIELDRDLIGRLDQCFGSRENFRLINADALTVDFSNFGANKIRIIGNLPYNISTPMIFHLLKAREQIEDMHFMLQKEVVKRLCSRCGSSAWGRLGIMVQYQCEVTELFEVPPESFDPPPKVNSAVVRLKPHDKYDRNIDISTLEKIVRIAFNKRRKTLRNALKEMFTEEQISDAGIDSKLRPENLAIEQYITLTKLLNVSKLGHRE